MDIVRCDNMDYMTHVMDRLEAWRVTNGLKKTEMSKLLGANTSQQYGNWVTRNSLPKEFFRRAADILGDAPSEVAPNGPPGGDQRIKKLPSPERVLAVKLLLDSLESDEKTEILIYLLSDKD